MTWLLTAKSGSSRGESWMIGSKPIVLGRSLSCDITIGDPTVSRKHCEVKLDGDGVVFRDLGSRNVSLVNGRVVEECRLLVGDELSLGTESFILTRTIASACHVPSTSDSNGSTTVSLDDAVFLHEDAAAPSPSPAFPGTVQELLRLYRFGRKLGRAHNEAEFATLCIQELEEVFPARIKPAVCCTGAGGLIWYPRDFVPSEDLLVQVSEVMARGEASLSSYRAKRLFFKEVVIAGAAPLMATGRSQGALVILSAARDYIPEPGALTHLNAIAQTASPYLGALEHQADISSTGVGPESVQFLGQSAAVSELRSEVDSAARSGLNALITGEPGTGKEFAARLIHRHSRNPEAPIISTNCITLTGPSFLSALTGSEQVDEEHRVTIRRGLLEQANGGTLVLRELDTLDAANQLELIQLMERGTYTRQGGQQALTFRGRIIGTTSQDLDHQVSEGDFRRDLLHLVARHRIHIKPLRRRPTDIRALAQYFVDAGKRQGAHQLKGLTEEALRYLEELPLHGNAVELRNTINQAIQQCRSEWLGSQDLRNSASPTTEHQAVLEPLEKAERTLISAVLTQCDGNAALAAEILGLPVATLERLTTVMDQSRAQTT